MAARCETLAKNGRLDDHPMDLNFTLQDQGVVLAARGPF